MRINKAGRAFGIASAVFFFILTVLNLISVVEMSSYALSLGFDGLLSLLTAIVQILVYITLGVFMIMGSRNVFVAIALFVNLGVLAFTSFYNLLANFDYLNIYYLAAITIDVMLMIAVLLFALLAWNEKKSWYERTPASKPISLAATVVVSVYSGIYLAFNMMLNVNVIGWIILVVSTACLLLAYIFLRFWLTARGCAPFPPPTKENKYNKDLI